MEQQGSSNMGLGAVPPTGGLDQMQTILNNPGNCVATCAYPPDAYLPKIGGKPVLPGSERMQKCVHNPGNPIATCTYPPDVSLPPTGEGFVSYPGWTQQTKIQHPMYTTTSNNYGNKSPHVHDMPTQFYARTQQFTQHLGTCGMYRNYSLNTEVDKSKF